METASTAAKTDHRLYPFWTGDNWSGPQVQCTCWGRCDEDIDARIKERTRYTTYWTCRECGKHWAVIIEERNG